MIVPSDTDLSLQTPPMFSSKGRLGRLRWLVYLTLANILATIASLAAVLSGFFLEAEPSGFLSFAIVAAYLWYHFLVTIQRSHDMGWSGWTSILTLIPFVGLIWLIAPGTKGSNEHGQPTIANSIPIVLASFIFPFVFIAGLVLAISLPAYEDYLTSSPP